MTKLYEVLNSSEYLGVAYQKDTESKLLGYISKPPDHINDTAHCHKII